MKTDIPDEVKWGITPEPDITCPLIDDALYWLEQATKELAGWQKTDDVDELKHKCRFTEIYLDSIFSKLEKIRGRAIELRSWGNEWKELAKNYAPTLNKYED